MWEKIPMSEHGHEDFHSSSGTNAHCVSHRLKVPGGWIVRTLAFAYRSGLGVVQTFVEDQRHEWELN